MGPTTAAAHQAYEERLADRVLEGENSAFRALVGHSLDRVLNVCYRTCLDRAEAERVAADSLAAAVRRLPELRLSGGGFGPLWLAAAAGPALDEAVRRVADRHRGALAPEPTRIYCDPAAAARAADHQLLIRSAVARLHPRHRKLLALADGSGMSCAEIAVTVGEPVRSVAASLGRARLGLAGELRGGRRTELAISDECAMVPARFVLRDSGELGCGEQEILTLHLGLCGACTASVRASTEARAAYARWLDITPSAAMLARLRVLNPGGGGRRVEALRLLRSSAARRVVLTSAVSASALVIGAAMALRSDSPPPAETHAGLPVVADPAIGEGERRADAARDRASGEGPAATERARRAADLASRNGETRDTSAPSQRRSRSGTESERERTRRRRVANGRALAAESDGSEASGDETTSARRGGLLRNPIATLIGGDSPRPIGIRRPRPGGGGGGQAEEPAERPAEGNGSGEGDRQSKGEPPPQEP